MFSISYEALFAHNTDAILVVNSEGLVEKANPAFYTLTQLARQAVQQVSYQRFFHYEQADSELTVADQRAQLICKDGESVPILVRKIEGESGFFVLIKDMRALDAIAERALQSELRYRAIAENIQDVLILMDAHKNYLYVSPSALEMFHFDYRLLENRSAFFNIHPDDVAQIEQSFDRAMVEGMPFTVKVRGWHEEQGWVWTEIKGQPMYEHGTFQHMLLVARDVSSQHHYEEGLLNAAHTDMLTNLPNRRKLNGLLKEAKSTLQAGRYFAVMLMDIDNFKHINDYYGHEIGDYVLVEYGQRVSAVLGDKGIIGRHGGDEFIVLLPYEEQQQVEEVARQIVVDMQRPIEIQQTVFSITTSVGVALVEADVSVRKMLKCADDALYKVKGFGKNGFFIADVKEMYLQQLL